MNKVPMETTRKRLDKESRIEIILNAACNLFAEYGYDKTSTKQLAKASNCSEALLYKYFDSKKAIMDALLDEWVEAHNKKVKLDIIENSALRTLRKHYEDFLLPGNINYTNSTMRENLIDALNSTPYYHQKAKDAFLNGTNMIEDTIIPIIKFGQENGEIKSGDANIMANLFVGYMVGAKEIMSNFPDYFSPLPFDTLIQTTFL